MKRRRLKPLLIGLTALLLITGLVALPVVREMRQEAKDRALIAAVKRNDADAVVHLLNEGANPNARNLPMGTRSFWRVCLDVLQGRHWKRKKRALTALLIAVSASPEGNMTSANSIITTPEPETEVRIVRALLEHGADANIPDGAGRPPLRDALCPTRTRTALLLIQHGAKVDYARSVSLLAEAAYQDVDPRVLQAMINRGSPVNL